MQPKNDECDWLGRAAARFFSMGQATHVPKYCLKHVTERCNNKNWSSKPIMGGGGGSGLYTWKPVASLWVTIVKISPEHTALLIHDENCDKDCNKTIPTMHRMTQHKGLSKHCPQGTCLLGQIIFDTPLSGKPPVPNILVFDVLQVGDYLDATGLSARERYSILRETCAPFLAESSVHIQWAGDLEPARKFCSRTGTGGLPHEVECIFSLSNEHPCDVVGSWALH